jgi:subtilase family serine protease
MKMLYGYPRASRQRRSTTLRSCSVRAGHARRLACRPVVEFLEVRLTPTASIGITNVYLVNGSDQTIEDVVDLSAGQDVWVQAIFATDELPSNARYQIAFNFNGLTVDGESTTFGAGASGLQYGYSWLGPFVVSPGTNEVGVRVNSQATFSAFTFGDGFKFSATASPPVGALSYTVSQIRSAYGINSIPSFGATPADGTGQTIAIVDPYNDPSILTDLDGFDEAMQLTPTSTESLYQQYGPASSVLTVFNQNGVNITSQIGDSGQGGVPPVDPTGDWEGDETLGVEWAHAIAPGAKIDLIECTGSGSFLGLFTGAATAASLPGVTVVSMNWIWNEGNWSSSGGAGELAYDSSTFVTPAGHPGVTFLASTGDGGAHGGYPAFSPNVIAVGATQLTVDGDRYGGSTYAGETAWSFPTPRTLNNGSSSYSQTGAWTSNSSGFSGTYSTAAGGSDSTATWTTTISSADQGWDGGTHVSATWVPSAGNATNATYEIYDGTAATGTLLGTVTVDQTKAPVGTSDGNTQFQELGDYHSQSGTLTVVLQANSANGTVAADAVGIAPDWATGGGQSQYETEPSYQDSVQSTGFRTSPDVAFDGSDDSGVIGFQNGGVAYDGFGTSLSSPCWAGLIAIADQGRAYYGVSSFDSPANPEQALQALYNLPAADFHEITSGYNGLSAGPGYDELTGLGSPIANLLVPDLASSGLPILSPGSLPSATYRGDYNQTITATETGGAGAPFTFTVSDGALPNGLSLAPGGGLTGFPTVVGTFSFTVTATDSGGVTGSYAYTLTVNRATLTVSGITAANKVYNASTAATLNTSNAALVGVVSGDTFTLNTSGATGTFASDSVGTGITVTVAGLTISGPQAGDYTLTQPTTTANITRASLTVSGVTAANKTYNASTAATVNTSGATLVGVFSGDTVNLDTGAATGTFASDSVENGITVAVAGLTISGAQAGDYTLTQPTTTANITRASLTVSGVTATNKTYNGSTAATINTSGATLVGVFSGDTVSLNTGAATGAFASDSAGNGITVTIAGVTISGAQADDYTVAQPTTTANIAPAPLTVTASNNEKMTYGGTVPALTYTYAGLVNGDTSASFTGSLSTTATKSSDAGSYPVTLGSLAATGNYTIGTFDQGTLKINPAGTRVSLTPTYQTQAHGKRMYELVVTVTTTVPGGPIPVGTVVFHRNGGTFGSATLRKGTATITLDSTRPAKYKFQAVFKGGRDFDSSTSPPEHF